MKQILILYPSWEERAYLGFKKYIEGNTVDEIFLIEKENSQNLEKTQKSLSSIIDLCITNKLECKPVLISNNDRDLFEKLNEFINQLDINDSITIDITTMSRNIIWSLLFFIKQKYKEVKLIYHLPEKYCGSWISREPSTPSLLMKHSGIIDLDLKNCLVIITGFDTDRTKQIVRFYEPQKIVLLVQSGNRFENDQRNNQVSHKKVCEDLGYNTSNIDIQSIDSYSKDLGFEVLEAVISKYKSGYNLVLTSLGPKPSAISLYQAFLNNPEIGLSYVPCKEYNPDYSTGISDTFEKTIKLNV